MIVAATGLNTAAEPDAGYGVLTSLRHTKNRDLKLIGLAYRPFETGLYHPGLMDRAFIVPTPEVDQDAFLDRVSQIKKDFGLDIIIPGLDAEIPLFAELVTELQAIGIKTLLPDSHSIRHMQAKVNKQLPDTAATSATGDTASPVLTRAFVKTPVCEQPAVDPAVALDLFAVCAVADRDANVVAMASIKKLLCSPQGGTWMALTIDNGEFAGVFENMLIDTCWKGPINIEIIRNQWGEQYIASVRPLFPDWINLAAMAGANLPAILVDLIAGDALTSPVQMQPGKLFVRSSVDIVTDVNRFGILSLTGEINHDTD